MGFLFKGYTPLTIAGALVMLLGLMLLNWMTRRSKTVSIIAYCICPVLLCILLLTDIIPRSEASHTWFSWVKLISALAAVIPFMAIRYGKLGKTKFAYYFPPAILIINVIQAIYRDFEVFLNFQTPAEEGGLWLMGGPWNIMSAVAGIFLLLAITGWMGIRVSNTKTRDMVWPDTLWFWIVAYTLWNFAYSYNCLSTRSMYAGLMLLLSCGLSEVFSRGMWLQHRAHCLAIMCAFALVSDYHLTPMFSITPTYDPVAMTVVSAVALIANVAIFVYEILVIRKTKRNPFKQEIYTDLKAYQKNLTANGLEVTASSQ